MAESGMNCVECGHLVAMFSGITINGAAYHSHCWDRVAPVPKSSGGGHSDQPHDRPRVMPVVEQLQLGRTRL